MSGVVVTLTEEQASAMGDLHRSLEYDINGTPSDQAFHIIAEALRWERGKRDDEEA